MWSKVASHREVWANYMNISLNNFVWNPIQCCYIVTYRLLHWFNEDFLRVTGYNFEYTDTNAFERNSYMMPNVDEKKNYCTEVRKIAECG